MRRIRNPFIGFPASRILPVAVIGAAVVAGVTLLALDPGDPPKKPPRPKLKPDEDGAEPWEIEAKAVGELYADDPDEPDELPSDPVGSGSPEEHCVPGMRASPLLGANQDEEEYFCVAKPLEDPEFAPVDRGADHAPVPIDSMHPVITKHPRRLVTSYKSRGGWRGDSGRSFGASRGEKRRHAGHDSFGNVGDVIVAPEDAVVFRAYPFKDGTWAIYLWTFDDRIINLGEVEENSWRKYKIKPGVLVKKGQPLARIGAQDRGGAHMLHTEIYDVRGLSEDDVEKKIRTSYFRWYKDQPPPPELLDPTSYMIMAGTRTYRKEQSESTAQP